MSEQEFYCKLGSIEWWDAYFSPNGGWEKNGGREQTRIFASKFCEKIDLGTDSSFSILDVGCALGEALKVFQSNYPLAQLYGIDISSVAVSRCILDKSIKANFMIGRIDDIINNYDVIYISNVLEHFSNFDDIAARLITNCERLCIMVPYNEKNCGENLKANSNMHHQHTFEKNSFDYLVDKKLASSIKTHVISCPGAWGWTRKQRLKNKIINLVRLLRLKTIDNEPLQIIYDIRR